MKVNLFGFGALAHSLANKFQRNELDVTLIHPSIYLRKYKGIPVDNIINSHIDYLEGTSLLFDLNSNSIGKLKDADLNIVASSIEHFDELYENASFYLRNKLTILLTSYWKDHDILEKRYDSKVIVAYPNVVTEICNGKLYSLGNYELELDRKIINDALLIDINDVLKYLKLPYKFTSMRYRFRSRFILTTFYYWLLNNYKSVDSFGPENLINEYWIRLRSECIENKDLIAIPLEKRLIELKSIMCNENRKTILRCIIDELLTQKRYKIDYFFDRCPIIYDLIKHQPLSHKIMD